MVKLPCGSKNFHAGSIKCHSQKSQYLPLSKGTKKWSVAFKGGVFMDDILGPDATLFWAFGFKFQFQHWKMV